jgi:hypothetical protein
VQAQVARRVGDLPGGLPQVFFLPEGGNFFVQAQQVPPVQLLYFIDHVLVV